MEYPIGMRFEWNGRELEITGKYPERVQYTYVVRATDGQRLRKGRSAIEAFSDKTIDKALGKARKR